MCDKTKLKTKLKENLKVTWDDSSSYTSAKKLKRTRLCFSFVLALSIARVGAV